MFWLPGKLGKKFSWAIGGTGGEDVEQERRDLDKMVDVGVHHGSRRVVQGAELFLSLIHN